MTAHHPPYEALTETLRRLRLPAFAMMAEQLVQQDPETASVILPLLAQMADEEQRQRQERRVHRCIKDAQFIRLQTVDSFNFNYNPSTRKLKKRYLQLYHADPVKEGVGAIFVGNSGLGKTHLARALGCRYGKRGYKIRFSMTTNILNRLVAAEATRDLERVTKKLQTPALLFIDGLAYLSMSQQEANLFFQVISRRHDNNRPIVVTTNKPFAQWNQVFHGDAIAHAIVDRLTERVEIFHVEGKSYRQTHRKGL